MDATALGFVVGLMIAAIALVCIFKYANKDGKIRTTYDERQKAVRGKAYKYSFYTVVFAQTAVMCLLMSDIELPIEDYALVFSGILIGCTFLGVYCIWNDVYWGLNNNHKRYHIVFIVSIVLNALPVYFGAISGTLMENGKIGMPLLNILVLIMMAIVYAELLIKKMIEKNADGED